MRVGAVVLAAGASKRLGEPKQLVGLGLETLLERAVRVACQAGSSPVVVVLGASAELIRAGCKLQNVVVVTNERWAEGMGSSIQVGVEALGDVEACIIMTCDMPAVTVTHLHSLMAADEVTGSSYAGRRGVPAYFPKHIFPTLLELTGDTGARDLLRSARCVELIGGELDIDTAEDLAKARSLFR
jgi:molybdenum cofactor cytidylyltransferase